MKLYNIPRRMEKGQGEEVCVFEPSRLRVLMPSCRVDEIPQGCYKNMF
jgi:hypothetical protein